MRYVLLVFASLVLALVIVAGLRGHPFSRPPIEVFSDMDRQPKVKAQVPSNFFADGRAAREPVAGTVPMGFTVPSRDAVSDHSAYRETGKMGDHWGTGFPMEITAALMQRGQERYGISCAICHGATGAGDGMAFKFGLVTVQSLNQPRLRKMADGEIFNTIAHGKNTMMGLGDRISVPDRWAIIAYLRALQKSQGGTTLNDLPLDEQGKLPAP